MTPIVLFRKDVDTEEEYNVCCQHFSVVEYRSDIKECLVIPRYSALPYYSELQYDVEKLGGKLINRLSQFNYIANFEYYYDIEEFTFKTYFDVQKLPDIPLVVKGKTNSLKRRWNSHCFANNRRKAIEIFTELKQDPLIGSQDIIFREYCPLKTYETFINGLPCTNEYRFFFCYGKLLCCGYYWSQAEVIDRVPDKEGIDLAEHVANIIYKRNNFFAIDIAQKENGEWVVVEVNSGEMSGLSLCDANELYKNIQTIMR